MVQALVKLACMLALLHQATHCTSLLGNGHRNSAKTKLVVKNVGRKFIKEQVKELNLFCARFQSVKHLRTARSSIMLHHRKADNKTPPGAKMWNICITGTKRASQLWGARDIIDRHISNCFYLPRIDAIRITAV